MPINIKSKDIALSFNSDFILELDDAGIQDIKTITNEENELLMQNIILRLSSNKNEWAQLSNQNIIPIDFSMFLGMPLDETLMQAISDKIIASLVFQNLLSIDEITVSTSYYSLNECYLGLNIKPKNNQNFKKSLLISYDSSTNILTPTVIDYIER